MCLSLCYCICTVSVCTMSTWPQLGLPQQRHLNFHHTASQGLCSQWSWNLTLLSSKLRLVQPCHLQNRNKTEIENVKWKLLDMWANSPSTHYRWLSYLCYPHCYVTRAWFIWADSHSYIRMNTLITMNCLHVCQHVLLDLVSLVRIHLDWFHFTNDDHVSDILYKY